MLAQWLVPLRDGAEHPVDPFRRERVQVAQDRVGPGLDEVSLGVGLGDSYRPSCPAPLAEMIPARLSSKTRQVSAVEIGQPRLVVGGRLSASR